MRKSRLKAEIFWSLLKKSFLKAEGGVLRLSTVQPSPRAMALAKKLSNDPRFIEVVLGESRRSVRSDRVLIVAWLLGLVCANAGVDLHSKRTVAAISSRYSPKIPIVPPVD